MIRESGDTRHLAAGGAAVLRQHPEIDALAGEALEQLRETVFDCMIIDLKLPDIQGSELLQRMSTEDICSFPPVIVYTGRALSRDERASLVQTLAVPAHIFSQL